MADASGEELVLPSDSVCAKCGLAIIENGVLFQKKILHTTCLVCEDCGKKLSDNIIVHDEKTYCEEHYIKRFTKACARCGGRITGAAIDVGDGRFYHSDHFMCIHCNRVIKAKQNFVLDNDEPSCLECQSLLCGICGGLIASGNYYCLQTEGGSIVRFHDYCHKCNVCNRTFGVDLFVIFHDNQLYCEADFKVAFPDSEVHFSTQIAPENKSDTSRGQLQDIVNANSYEPNHSAAWLFEETELSGPFAEVLLRANGGINSFFIYNTDSDRSRDHALVFLYDTDDVRHFAINRDDQNKFMLNNREERFESLDALVDHYLKQPLVDNACLGSPVEFTELRKLIQSAQAAETARLENASKAASIQPASEEEESDEIRPPKIQLSDLHAWARKQATYNMLIESAKKLEQRTSSPSQLATVRNVLAQAEAQSKLLQSLLTSQGEVDVFDTKDKFKDQEFFNAALSVLENQLKLANTELERLYQLAAEKDEMTAKTTEDDEVDAQVQPATTETESQFNLWVQELWDACAVIKADGKVDESEFTRLGCELFPYKKPESISLYLKENKACKSIRSKARKEGGFTLESFIEFVHLLFDDSHLLTVFKRYSKTSSETMTILEFKTFLTQQQRIHNIEPVLQLYYSLKGKMLNKDVVATPAIKTFGRYLAVTNDGTLTPFGFMNFVHSSFNSIFNERHSVVYQDMTRPLTHYFIDCSHNTYLEKDQLTSASTTEAYKKVLLAGARCLELDLWDGPNNSPIIYHGHTLTSKVRARDVLETIARHAFEASPYPIILSLENHLSLSQQKVFVQYVKEIFPPGTVPNAETDNFWDLNQQELPSPEALKFKILMKNRAHPSRRYSFTNKDAEKKTKVAQEMSDLVVYTKSGRVERLETAVTELKVYEMMSCAEKKGYRLFKTSFDTILNYTSQRLLRSYPDGLRFDSSNYDPIPFWNVGTHMVAMNFQTPDRAMQLDEGKFKANGRCGYVLKPDWMVDQTNEANVSRVVLSIKLLAGFHLTHPKRKKPVPYVEIEVVGLTEKLVTSAAARQDTGPAEWNEMFTWDIYSPELALIRFVVMDETLGSKDIIGQYTMPVESLRQGYRFVPLERPQPFLQSENDPYATLLINASVTVPLTQQTKLQDILMTEATEQGDKSPKAPRESNSDQAKRQKFDDVHPNHSNSRLNIRSPSISTGLSRSPSTDPTPPTTPLWRTHAKSSSSEPPLSPSIASPPQQASGQSKYDQFSNMSLQLALGPGASNSSPITPNGHFDVSWPSTPASSIPSTPLTPRFNNIPSSIPNNTASVVQEQQPSVVETSSSSSITPNAETQAVTNKMPTTKSTEQISLQAQPDSISRTNILSKAEAKSLEKAKKIEEEAKRKEAKKEAARLKEASKKIRRSTTTSIPVLSEDAGSSSQTTGLQRRASTGFMKRLFGKTSN